MTKYSMIRFSIFILFSFSITAFGQIDEDKNERRSRTTGIKAGLNYHWEKGLNSDPDIGLILGYGGIFPVNKLFAWQVGAQYMQFGSRFKTVYQGVDVDGIYNKDYISANTSFNFIPFDFFDIHAGGYLGGTVNKKLIYRGNGVNESIELDQVPQAGVGIYFGVNIFIKNIGIAFEYYNGAIDTFQTIGDRIVLKNRSYAVHVTYFL